jgi:glycosyltransferase involved in cell wall biosynthesis
VAFDIMTGPSDIIDHEINGFLVKPVDLDAMADRIRQLVENDALRCQMAENAAMGMEKFSEERILNSWQEVLGNG